MGVQIRFYTTAAGNSPVERYLSSLEAQERATVLDALSELEQRGLRDSQTTKRQIEGKLWEIKVSRHRIFFVMVDGPIVVLLHGYKKQGQKAPRADIDVARARMKEVLRG